MHTLQYRLHCVVNITMCTDTSLAEWQEAYLLCFNPLILNVLCSGTVFLLCLTTRRIPYCLSILFVLCSFYVLSKDFRFVYHILLQ